jgi:hypothetical protein
VLPAERDALLPVEGYPHHLDAGQHPDETREAVGEEPLVVHDRYPDGLFFAVAQEPRPFLGRRLTGYQPRVPSAYRKETRLRSSISQAGAGSIVNWVHRPLGNPAQDIRLIRRL